MTPATKLTEADREALREARAKSPAALQARIASLTAEVERLREALTTILPYIATQSVGCHGDKCREIWCYSCNGEDDANVAAMAGAEAFLMAHAALHPEEGV